MPAPEGLYHAVCERLERCWPTAGRSRPALRRLGLLITGLIAARSGVLAQIAAELWALEVTGASTVASIERRLRRTLSDERLTPPTCYQAELARCWTGRGSCRGVGGWCWRWTRVAAGRRTICCG